MVALDFPDAPTNGQVFDKWTWNGTAWVLTGGSARGTIGYGQATAHQAGITTSTVITGLTVTWTADATRRYRTTVVAQVASTVANDLAILAITDGSGTEKNGAQTSIGVANQQHGMTAAVVELGLSGSVTRRAILVRATGSGTLTSFAQPNEPAYILVEDIGT